MTMRASRDGQTHEVGWGRQLPTTSCHLIILEMPARRSRGTGWFHPSKEIHTVSASFLSSILSHRRRRRYKTKPKFPDTHTDVDDAQSAHSTQQANPVIQKLCPIDWLFFWLLAHLELDNGENRRSMCCNVFYVVEAYDLSSLRFSGISCYTDAVVSNRDRYVSSNEIEIKDVRGRLWTKETSSGSLRWPSLTRISLWKEEERKATWPSVLFPISGTRGDGIFLGLDKMLFVTLRPVRQTHTHAERRVFFAGHHKFF